MTEIIKPNKPTSDKEVVKLENQLQVTLPAEYRSFLLKYNGGVPNNLEFTAEKYGDSILREFLGLGVGDIHDIYYGLATFKGRVPTEFLVIGRDLAGNMILLGIKDKYVGKIYFWWHENESGGKKPWLKNIYKISNSFNSFWDKLKAEPIKEKPKDSLFELFRSQDYDKQMALINSGWDVNALIDKDGETAIGQVASRGSLNVLKALIEKGARLDGVIERAIFSDNLEATKLLLESGVDPNQKTENGESNILMFSIRGERKDIAKLLIEHGADVKIGNLYNTPLSAAELKVKRGNVEMQEIVALIKSKLKNN